MAGISLLNVKTNDELTAMDAAREDALTPKPQAESINELAAYIRDCWKRAELHRSSTMGGGSSITDRLLDCQRRRRGIYSAEKLHEIKERGGSDLFFNITDTKASAAEAWIDDVIRPRQERPWGIKPTPVPDLPEDVKLGVVEEVTERFRYLQAQGEIVTWAQVREATLKLYDQAQQAQDEEADERAKRMDDKIADQLAEGGWEKAMDDAIRDLCTYPNGIVKGPVVKRMPRLKWEGQEPKTVFEEVPTWVAVSPHDFYPAPNVRDVNESFVCESIRISKAELSRQRQAEGWSASEIDAVLAEGGSALQLPTEPTGESERAQLEDRNPIVNNGQPEDGIKGIEFWGNVQGKLLKEWGMAVADENEYYHITALLIGSHVVRAIANPDPLGRNPYFVTTYEHVPGSIWGRAIAEKMADCQDAVNGCLRNALSNLGLASGPQVVVDVDALDPAIDPTVLYPWKTWQTHGSRSNPGRDPVSFFQPASNADELTKVAEYYEQKADDRTLIPRYAHGNEDVGGAGQTASGLSMLMTSAAKGIQRVISNIDREVIRPVIEHLYRWNLMYLDDAEWNAAKGDIRVVPHGVMAAIVREQTQQRRMQFLATTNNPMDAQIIGLKERAALLRAVAQDLEMPIEDIVPSEDEVVARAQMQEMAAAEMGMAEGAGQGGGGKPPAERAPAERPKGLMGGSSGTGAQPATPTRPRVQEVA